MLRRITLLAGFMTLVCAPALRAQAPDVQGTCVSGCGNNNGNSTARDQRIARSQAQHAKELQWYNAIEQNWNSAVKKGNEFSRKGQQAQAKGDCAGAIDYYQRELAAFSVNTSLPGTMWDAGLGGKYQLILMKQQQAVTNARNRLAGAQANCAQRPPIAAIQPPAPQPVQQFKQQPAAVSAASPATLIRIGAAAGVRGSVYWEKADGTKVPIKNGSIIYFGSKIVTGAGGHFQVLLLDESVFTLGPNAEMVLDEFVYDPNTSAGKVAANFIKGTFRFVTGKMMHKDPADARVKMAVGTIGIRGTDFEVKYEPGSEGYIKLKKGEIDIAPSSGAAFSMKPGDKAKIEANGTILPPRSNH